MIRQSVIALAVVVLLPSAVHAQVDNCPFAQELIAGMAAGADNVDDLVDIGQHMQCFLLLALAVDEDEAFGTLVQRAEGLRTDKDSTAGGSTAGSTSIVAEGATAKVLSFAAEYGALTQSVSGQVVTVRGNLAGLPSALARYDVFPYCLGSGSSNAFCARGSLLSILRRVSFGVSFDASRQDQVVATTASTSPDSEPAPVVFSAGGSTLAAFSVRVDLWNQRDVTSPAFRTEWQEKAGEALTAVSEQLLRSNQEVYNAVQRLQTYADWRTAARAGILAAGQDEAQIAAAWFRSMQELVTLAEAGIINLDGMVNDALGAYRQFWLASDSFTDTLATKSILALEFRGDRPVGQPRTTNVRLIFDKPLGPQTRFIANGGVTLYNSTPAEADVSRYRDVQIGAQLDQEIGTSALFGRATFGLAGYLQYQNAPAILTVNPQEPIPGIRFQDLPENAATVLAEKGTIWLVQTKLSLAASDSGISVPIALSYSNRTELIDKPAWRAQVGLSYNFDGLFAALGR